MPNGGLRVVDLTTGMELWNARAAEENVKALAFSPDGKVLASGAGFVESAIRLWDVASGREINRLAGHRSWVGALIFWPDGKTLASAGADQTICLWDVSDPARVPPPRILRGHKQEVRVLALLPDNTTLVSGCKDGSVYFWDTSAKPHAPPRVTLPKPVAAWQWAADGSSVLTLDLEGHVARWQGAGFQKSEPLMDIGTNFFPKRGLPISRGGRRLATGSTNGFIQVWDLQRGSLLRQFKASQTAVRPHTFLGQREKLVVVRDDDQSFHEWDLSSWEEVRSWRGAANWTGLGSAFSPDERWCLTLGEQNEGSLISMATGQARNVNLNIKRVRGVAFSPDGTLIAATSEQGGAKLWKAGTLEEVANLEGLLLSPAFSPDSLRLAISGNGDEGMTLWDVASHEELLILPAQGSMIHDTRFSADGTVLGCVNGVGILQLWRAPSWAEIERAERQRARKTSTSE
jgi:WD40 repeat protein